MKKSQKRKVKKLPTTKKCSICEEFKLLNEFSPCKTGSHGLYAYCKICRNKLIKEQNPNRKEIDEKKARRIGLKKQGLKTCTSCKDIKYIEEFYGDPRHTDGKQTHCKECFNQRNNAAYLKKEYGINRDIFKKLLEAQDGRCAICNRPPKKNKFNIDHCHKTHRIRALLCVNCNTNLLPFVERFPHWVMKAFDYLKDPPAFKVIGEIQVPETNQARKKVKKEKEC